LSIEADENDAAGKMIIAREAKKMFLYKLLRCIFSPDKNKSHD